MINHTPRRFLAIDCKQRRVRRYVDRRRFETVSIEGGNDWGNITNQIERFRQFGAPKEPQRA